MPLKGYGVLKGTPIRRVLGQRSNPHYHVLEIDEELRYRVAVNVFSQESPSEVEYLVDEHFQHPILEKIHDLPHGFTELADRSAGHVNLDFIRMNLFNRDKMVPLAFDLRGPDNDLNEKLDREISAAMADEQSILYAFGQRWGPEERLRDKVFGFLPGNGIHDVHMNQGNSQRFQRDDGVYQDGGLILHFPADDRWVGIFLKFQSQTWHTDDRTGHAIGEAPRKPKKGGGRPGHHEGEPDHRVRIIAALVNPPGDDTGKETVTLLNTTRAPIDLAGWTILDRLDHAAPLSGTIPGASAITVDLPATVQLGNDGGLISLLDKNGLKVDGVSYTRGQVSSGHGTVTF